MWAASFVRFSQRFSCYDLLTDGAGLRGSPDVGGGRTLFADHTYTLANRSKPSDQCQSHSGGFTLVVV